MTFERHLCKPVSQHFTSKRQAIVLTGPRQIGKTQLLKSLFPQASYFNCDDEPTRQIFNSHAIATYKQYLKSRQTVILDEVQNLQDPGRVGKLIVDELPQLKLIITGSAGLTIRNQQSESMAGRAISYELLPLTLSEYLTQQKITGAKLNHNLFNHFIDPVAEKPPVHSLLDTKSLLERILIFGLYPALLNTNDLSEYLNNLAERIILRDLVDLQLIEHKNKALKLLKVLAHQIGQVVSMAELSNQTDLDQRTVSKYLNLFQESYLIYLLYPYSQRERDVLSKRPKVYFYDTGLRNALIKNYEQLTIRPDKGQLFENFLVMEAVKSIRYQNLNAKLYYWRTKNGAEMDLVIDFQSQLFGIECKWQKGRPSLAFSNRYPNSIVKVINQNIATLAAL